MWKQKRKRRRKEGRTKEKEKDRPGMEGRMDRRRERGSKRHLCVMMDRHPLLSKGREFLWNLS